MPRQQSQVLVYNSSLKGAWPDDARGSWMNSKNVCTTDNNVVYYFFFFFNLLSRKTELNLIEKCQMSDCQDMELLYFHSQHSVNISGLIVL